MNDVVPLSFFSSVRTRNETSRPEDVGHVTSLNEYLGSLLSSFKQPCDQICPSDVKSRHQEFEIVLGLGGRPEVYNESGWES